MHKDEKPIQQAESESEDSNKCMLVVNVFEK